ncbi:hypothetical protein ACWHAO_04710 [Streptomyces albidoflavus]
MSFDWAGLEQAVQAQLTGFVRRMRAEHPDDRLYAAAVHEFSAETGSVIAWPLVGVAWEPVHARYLRTVVKACRAARRELLAEGTAGRLFLVVAMDEAWELVPRTLTPAQVRRHFPELDAESRETARLAALPPTRAPAS